MCKCVLAADLAFCMPVVRAGVHCEGVRALSSPSHINNYLYTLLLLRPRRTGRPAA